MLHHDQPSTLSAHHGHDEGRCHSTTMGAYPRRKQLVARTTQKRIILLIVADSGLRTRLAHLLQTNGYAVFTVAETEQAIALLAKQQIDLIIIHYTPEISTIEWEGYNNLRQHTTKPVIGINNITATHFAQLALQVTNGEAQATLQNYLRGIDLIWPAVVGHQ